LRVKTRAKTPRKSLAWVRTTTVERPGLKRSPKTGRMTRLRTPAQSTTATQKMPKTPGRQTLCPRKRASSALMRMRTPKMERMENEEAGGALGDPGLSRQQE
jgi:hypothetical protein